MTTEVHSISLGEITVKGDGITGPGEYTMAVEDCWSSDGVTEIALVLRNTSGDGRWARIRLGAQEALWLRNRLERGCNLILEDSEHSARDGESLSPA